MGEGIYRVAQRVGYVSQSDVEERGIAAGCGYEAAGQF